MRSRIRTVCFSTALCLIVSCYAAIPSYASSDVATGAAQDSNSTTPDAIQISTDDPSDTTTPSSIKIADPNAKSEDDESLWYSKKLLLKKEHQKLLWDYCKKRNLDYIDMLALIATESNFYEKCSSGPYKGYFQICKSSGPNLAKVLKTLNTPLDGSININWGTALYSWILQDKRVKDMEGKKKRDTALAIFQRGPAGYDKHGINYAYLKTYYKKRDIICSYFEKDK